MYYRTGSTRGADKSLARPGRKQRTATKLGIYSTYSPRSSIYFLAHCSNFCKPLKTKSEGCPSNQVSVAAMTSASDEKWRPFNCFFQSREQVVVWWGRIRRIGWVIKTLETHVDQFLLGCKCPVRWGIVVQEREPLGDFPEAFFLQNVLQLHQQRWVIPRIDSLALWKIINQEDAVLIPKDRGENLSSGFLHLEFFGAGWAAMPPLHWWLLLPPGHSDITRFRPWSPIATGNHLDRAEKIPKVAQTTGTVYVFDSSSGISVPTSRRASACPNLHEWWTQPAHVRCPVAQLLI